MCLKAHIYVCMCVSMCIDMCVKISERERERGGGERESGEAVEGRRGERVVGVGGGGGGERER